MKLRTPFFCAVLLAGCFGDKEAVDIWLGLAADSADCYSTYADCVRLTDGDEDAMEVCVVAYEGCYEDAEDAAREADGEDGCITAAFDCTEDCGDDDGCYDDCRDDFEECAPWYQRDCEEDCEDEAAECFNLAIDEHASDLDALMAAAEECMDELFEDCIPACYDQ